MMNLIKDHMNIVKNKNEELRLKECEYNTASFHLKSLIKTWFESEMKIKFPNVRFNYEVSFFINDKSNNPVISIYTIDGKTYTKLGKWINHHKQYVTSPIDMKILQEFTDYVGKELSIVIKLVKNFVKTKKDIQNIKESKDLEVMYDSIKILEEGTYVSKIDGKENIFFITKYMADYTLFLSTNGTENGVNIKYDRSSRIPEFHSFFDTIEQSEKNLHLRNKYLEDIIFEWNLPF